MGFLEVASRHIFRSTFVNNNYADMLSSSSVLVDVNTKTDILHIGLCLESMFASTLSTVVLK